MLYEAKQGSKAYEYIKSILDAEFEEHQSYMKRVEEAVGFEFEKYQGYQPNRSLLREYEITAIWIPSERFATLDKKVWRKVDSKMLEDGYYVFETTNEFPDGYEIWAIGRRNFKHKGYVPLCEVDESRYVKRDTLKALKVKDEALALTLLSEAVKRGVNKKKYNIMINAKENG